MLGLLYVLNDCFFSFGDEPVQTDEGSEAPTCGLGKQDMRDLALPQVGGWVGGWVDGGRAGGWNELL